jgi:hypothetical protein
LSSTTDVAHRLSGEANAMLFADQERGLLYGLYQPQGAGARYRTVNPRTAD